MANPTAMLLSAVLMFQHLGETEKAALIASAVEKVYANGKLRTRGSWRRYIHVAVYRCGRATSRELKQLGATGRRRELFRHSGESRI